ncbi:unnamed protein product, partial [Ectocarpus sp. 12 AP-2014]
PPPPHRLPLAPVLRRMRVPLGPAARQPRTTAPPPQQQQRGRDRVRMAKAQRDQDPRAARGRTIDLRKEAKPVLAAAAAGAAAVTAAGRRGATPSGGGAATAGVTAGSAGGGGRTDKGQRQGRARGNGVGAKTPGRATR